MAPRKRFFSTPPGQGHQPIWLAFLGGNLGIFAASFISLVTISTTNWDTFSELAFSFALSTTIVISAIVFALVMGAVGGFLPAVHASRLRNVDALRGE